MWGPAQNFGRIGSAVLTFIENKQPDRHPSKECIDCLDQILNKFYFDTLNFNNHKIFNESTSQYQSNANIHFGNLNNEKLNGNTLKRF